MTAGAVGPAACYPGSFDPLTVAHVAVAEAALRQGALARVDLVVSRHALAKDRPADDALEARVGRLRVVAEGRPWLGVVVTDAQLVVDIAEGYDAVVLGADKWRQVVDPSWYGSTHERDRAIARLPCALVAPRAADDLADLTSGAPGPPAGLVVLELDPRLRDVSASAVRSGLPHAAGWAFEG